MFRGCSLNGSPTAVAERSYHTSSSANRPTAPGNHGSVRDYVQGLEGVEKRPVQSSKTGRCSGPFLFEDFQTPWPEELLPDVTPLCIEVCITYCSLARPVKDSSPNRILLSVLILSRDLFNRRLI